MRAAGESPRARRSSLSAAAASLCADSGGVPQTRCGHVGHDHLRRLPGHGSQQLSCVAGVGYVYFGGHGHHGVPNRPGNASSACGLSWPRSAWHTRPGQTTLPSEQTSIRWVACPSFFAPKAIGSSPAGQRQAAASGQSLQRTALRQSGECLVRQCSNRLARPAGSPNTSPWADLGTQRKSDHHSARRMPGC
jgi:hypothetical protein